MVAVNALTRLRYTGEAKHAVSIHWNRIYHTNSLRQLCFLTSYNKCKYRTCKTINRFVYYYHDNDRNTLNGLRRISCLFQSKYIRNSINKSINSRKLSIQTKFYINRGLKNTHYEIYQNKIQSLLSKKESSLKPENVLGFFKKSMLSNHLTISKPRNRRLLSKSLVEDGNSSIRSGKFQRTLNYSSRLTPCPSVLTNLPEYMNCGKNTFNHECRAGFASNLIDDQDLKNRRYKSHLNIINSNKYFLSSFRSFNYYYYSLSHYSSGSSARSKRKQNYYEVLGVPTCATSREIKVAYFKLAKNVHPDLNPNDPKAKQKFVELSAAYEVLSDSKRRQEYDYNGYKTAEDIREEMYEQQQHNQSHNTGSQSAYRQNTQYNQYSRNFDNRHYYSIYDDLPHFRELFRQVQSERYIVQEALDEVMQNIQEDLLYAVNAGMRGEWKEVWEVAKENKGIIFTFVILPTIMFRFPPLTKVFISSLGVLSRIAFFAMSSGLVYPSTMSRYAWRLLVSSAKNKRKRNVRQSRKKKSSRLNSRENWKWWGKRK